MTITALASCIQYTRGGRYKLKKNYPFVVTQLDAAVTRFFSPHPTMSDLRRAVALINSRQFAAALPLLQSALRRSEQKPDGLSSAETAGILDKIGGCYIGLSNWRAAAEHYRRAAAISKYDIEGRINASFHAATAFSSIDKYEEAEAQTTCTLSMLHAEATAGTTAPAILKRHRSTALDFPPIIYCALAAILKLCHFSRKM